MMQYSKKKRKIKINYVKFMEAKMIKVNIRETIKSYGFQVNEHLVSSIIDFIDSQNINLNEIGISQEDISDKTQDQFIKYVIGEYLAKMGLIINKIASEFLGDAQGKYGNTDWFDHRHHLLNPERWFSHDWISSGYNVLKILPLDGTLLDICSGDGFFGYFFYRTRASHIDCIERNPELIRHSKRLYSAKNINYILADVLNYNLKPNFYDIIVIRGAIEHFSSQNQQILFQKAKNALKSGGWFCGDTPANPQKNKIKLLHDHENEWENEQEMRIDLKKVFDIIETDTFESPDRTTLLFKCKKI